MVPSYCIYTVSVTVLWVGLRQETQADEKKKHSLLGIFLKIKHILNKDDLAYRQKKNKFSLFSQSYDNTSLGKHGKC